MSGSRASTSGDKSTKETCSQRKWKRRKTNLVPTKLTDESIFDDWLAELRVALIAEDVIDLVEPSGNGPIVPKDLKAEYEKVCRDTILARLDPVHLDVIDCQDEPLEMLNKIKNFRQPISNAGAWAAFLDLWHWKYDTNLSVARNSLEFKKRVDAYNQQGEHLSERMKRDLFIQGVPFFLKKKILDQIRTLSVAEGGFKFIRSLIQEIIGEKENENKRSRERGNVNLLKFKKDNERSKYVRRERSKFRDRERSNFRDRANLSERNDGSEKIGRKHHDREDRKCFVCDSINHFAKDCPDADLVKCYKCNKMGRHFAKDCKEGGPSQQRKRTNSKGKFGKPPPKKEKKNSQILMARDKNTKNAESDDSSDTVSTESKTWIDSGASDHVVKNKNWLINRRRLSHPRTLVCANGGEVNVKYMGDIKVRGEDNSNLILKDVLANKEMTSNVLSVGRLAAKGYEITFDNKEAIVKKKGEKRILMRAPFDGKMWSLNLKMDYTKESEENPILICETRSAKRRREMKIESVEPEIKRKKREEKKKISHMEKESMEKEIEQTKEEVKEKFSQTEKDRTNSNKEGQGNIEGREKQKESSKNLGLLWHERLGHSSLQYLKYLATVNEKLKKVKFGDDIKYCEDCIRAKFHKHAHKGVRERKSIPLARIHTDVIAGLPRGVRTGARYIVTFIDDYSRYAHTYTMRRKNEVIDKFKEYISEVKEQFGEKYSIKEIRCDNGREYINKKMRSYCKKQGIKLKPCPAYTSPLNGTAERFNRTLEDKMRALLFDAGFPASFWEYAVEVACYTYNRVPNKGIKLDTPFKRWYEKEVDIGNLRRFGCLVYTRNTDPNIKKTTEKGVPRFLVGYTSTGYTLWDPIKHTESSVAYVHFIENVTYGDKIGKKQQDRWKPINESESGVNWLNGEKEGERIIEDVENTVDDDITENEEESDNESVEGDIAADEEENGSININLTKEKDEELSVEKALNGPDSELWKKAMKEEYNSIKSNENPIQLVNREEAKNIIDSKWILKIKKEGDGTKRYKARLVIRGFKQKKNYKTYETYAPVAKIAIVRLLLAIANKFKLKVHQFDVKTAFLNGELGEEEIYMEIPRGFTEEEKYRGKKVIRLKRALYGLKISPKKWNERFDKAMKEMGYQRDPAEPCAYYWKENEDFVLLVVYVDDILIISTKNKFFLKLKEGLEKNFTMTYMGEPKKYLGIQIERSNEQLFMHQHEYTVDLVKKYQFGKEKVKETPMLTRDGLRKINEEKKENEENEEEEENHKYDYSYREITGKLLFLANATRPDISYAVNVISRNQVNPKKEDWDRIKRVIEYLRGSTEKGLTYKGTEEGMSCFVDADFASDRIDRKSTTGFAIKLFGDTIMWRSKKQECVTTSTTEAEYVALAIASKEVMSLKGIYERINGKLSIKPIIYEDNRGAYLSANSGENKKLRHVDVSYHYTKWLVEKKVIEVKWIGTKQQEADFLTKALEKKAFVKCCRKIMNE